MVEHLEIIHPRVSKSRPDLDFCQGNGVSVGQQKLPAILEFWEW
ncbi:MAG TPA: hypothetical protein V6D43_20675 [Candidatus Sericytochromatia bacterium]